MIAGDLALRPPRRWSTSVDGVIWLPRLIDKARAFDAGTLGIYLFGQSPVDRCFLRAARLDHAAFLDAVRSADTDVDVLGAIERTAPGATARLRAWSLEPCPVCGFTFGLVDADEGYGRGPAVWLLALIPQRAFETFVGVLRRLRPFPRAPRR